MREKLAELQLAASNGIMFFEDADRDLGQPIDIGEAAVTAAEDTVIAQVLHGIDGLVSISVFADDGPARLPIEYFTGTITTRHGRLRIRDVAEDNLVTIGVEPGVCAVRIFVDSSPSPERVEVLIPPID